jgi:hypothetical protein
LTAIQYAIGNAITRHSTVPVTAIFSVRMKIAKNAGEAAVVDENRLLDDSGRCEDVASGDQQAVASSHGVIP